LCPTLVSGSGLDTISLGVHTLIVTGTPTFDGITGAAVSQNVSYTVNAPQLTPLPLPCRVAGAPDPCPAVTSPQTSTVVVNSLYESSKRLSLHAKKGIRFHFDADGAATVTFAFQRNLAGRKAGGRCAAPSRANRHGKACARWVPAGSMSMPEGQGVTFINFKGIVDGKRLPPGKYTIRVTAVAPGSSANPVDTVGTLRLTIVK
jgi:hypothetical protein